MYFFHDRDINDTLLWLVATKCLQIIKYHSTNIHCYNAECYIPWNCLNITDYDATESKQIHGLFWNILRLTWIEFTGDTGVISWVHPCGKVNVPTIDGVAVDVLIILHIIVQLDQSIPLVIVGNWGCNRLHRLRNSLNVVLHSATAMEIEFLQTSCKQKCIDIENIITLHIFL